MVERREVTLRRLADGVEDTVEVQTWLDYVTAKHRGGAPGGNGSPAAES